MSNIRFRRFSSASPEGWELDCIVLPDDEINGELIHYGLRKTVNFRGQFCGGLFSALDRQLDRAPEAGDTPRDQVRLVLGRLKNDERTHFHLKGLDEYSSAAPEAEIWRLVDSVFNEKIKAIK